MAGPFGIVQLLQAKHYTDHSTFYVPDIHQKSPGERARAFLVSGNTQLVQLHSEKLLHH